MKNGWTERIEELEARLSAMNALDPDGNWPSFGELALMFSEKCNEANALRKELDEASGGLAKSGCNILAFNAPDVED